MSSKNTEISEELQEEAGVNASAKEAADGSNDSGNPLEEKIAEQEEALLSLRKELSEAQDLFLRKQADMENYRKRLIRDKEDAVLYANRSLMLDIIEIVDNFERAIYSLTPEQVYGDQNYEDQAEETKREADARRRSSDFVSFHAGVVLIEKQFTDMLKRNWQLKRFNSLGKEFDPQKHEAMLVEEVEIDPDNEDSKMQRVLEVYQGGYMFRDSVLRTAKVKVSQPVSPNSDES